MIKVKKMKTRTNLKLIDGKFSPNEAREVLVSLFSSKIRFHEMQNLSSKERLGVEDERSKKRIPELLESKRLIAEIMEQAKTKNMDVIITSMVNIEICDQRP
jgi:hypothetical protein